MAKKIVVSRPGIGGEEREMILDAAAEAGYEVIFIPETAGESAGTGTAGESAGTGTAGDGVPDGGDYFAELLDAEIIYGEGPAVNAAAAQSDALKWLCESFAGVDDLCVPGAFKNEETILTNGSGSYGVSLAEHAIMLALMMMRRMPIFYDGIKARRWIEPLPQDGIKGARVTLLGTGDAGRCLARRIRGFEPESITGVCRSGKSDEEAFDRVVKTDRLAEVLAETDLLIMSLPGTPETCHLMNEEMFAAINPGAYLVNVGRGSVIDEHALIEALNAGKLAGAALDVLETEPPLQDSPLWDMPNLILTPHVAGNLTMEHTRKLNTEMFCEDLARYAKGEPLLHRVDRRRGY